MQACFLQLVGLSGSLGVGTNPNAFPAVSAGQTWGGEKRPRLAAAVFIWRLADQRETGRGHGSIRRQ